MNLEKKSIQSERLIRAKLSRIRRKLVTRVLVRNFLLGISAWVLVYFLTLTVEGFRYFNSSVRGLIFFTMIVGILFIVLIPLIIFLVQRNPKTGPFKDDTLALQIEKHYPDIRDNLLNSLQLSQITGVGFSQNLVQAAIEETDNQIRRHKFEKLLPLVKIRKSLWILLFVFAVCLLAGGINYDYYFASAKRIQQYDKEFAAPSPFQIQSLKGGFSVLGGDTLSLDFQVEGDIPENILLNLQYSDFNEQQELVVNESGRVSFQVKNLRDDLIYEAFVENHSIFKPWHKITSGTDTIRVINRPEILSALITLDYPNYTGLNDEKIEESQSEFQALPGTDIQVKIRANKSVSNGFLAINQQDLKPLECNGEYAYGNFVVTENTDFRVEIIDSKGVRNINPVNYKIRIKPDAFPSIDLLSPRENLELSEAMEIPLSVRIRDDFGFSRVQVLYEVERQFYDGERIQESQILPLNDTQLTLQEIFYTWDMTQLSIGPDEKVYFKIEVTDNDIIKGPKKSVTRQIMAWFPSLDELFSYVNETNDEVMDEGEQLLEEVREAGEALQEVYREMLKNPEVSYEQKSQIEKQLEKTKEAEKTLQEMADKLEQALEKSRENQLFDKETLQKYSEVQEAFHNIMTPELREAMQKLQDALEKMDPQETKKAMEQFQSTQDDFEKELDRMLKLFKRVQLEQTVDELTRRMEELVDRQEDVQENLDKKDPLQKKEMDHLAEKEKSIQKDTEIAQDIMERTLEDLKENPLMLQEKMEQIIEQMKESGLLDEMKQASKSMQQNNQEQAKQQSRQSLDDLQQISDMMQQFQQDFQQSNMQEVMSEFRKLIGKTLALSQQQEQMAREISNTPRQSDRLMDVAVKQQQIQQGLAKVVQDVIDLSSKTFGISPGLGKDLGEAAADMQEAISQMEERQTNAAGGKAKGATSALNRAAMQLIQSQRGLQQSGSSTGFEQFMEQMQKMAGQQQGLNNETMNLGMGKQPRPGNSLQQMAARQQQIKESLEQLQKDLESSGNQSLGDLGGTAKEMEEVIKDLKDNKVLQRTINRQQNILNRLLDAQKSLRTQSYKEERKSNTAKNYEIIAPGALPTDLGQRHSLLQEKLEEALEQGYNQDYEEIIRNYFEILSEDERQSESN